jgi:hypothetical protein
MIKPKSFSCENGGFKIQFEITGNGKTMTVTPSNQTFDGKFLFRHSSPAVVYGIGKCLIEAANAVDPSLGFASFSPTGLSATSVGGMHYKDFGSK